MASEYKPQQGDEAELFELYNDQLMRLLARVVRTSPEVIEDACSIAWAQFLRHQPDRNREWRAWLFRTARREAWVLDRKRREMRTFEDDWGDGSWVAEPTDRRDAFRERDELEAAFDVLAQLPPRLRRIAFLHATGHRYSEIQEITGDSRTRVSHLIRRANEHIRAALREPEATDVAMPPRAERLRELESSLPAWLTREIGRPPRGQGGRQAHATRLLDWRRAALAIEDYRQLTGFDSQVRALGARPRDEPYAQAFDTAQRAVDTVAQQRTCARGLGD
jgi:RNA polymerase sigma factor (sigma-70 family)